MSTREERRVGNGAQPPTSAYRHLGHVYRRALVDCLARRSDGIALADAASDVASRYLDRSVRESSPEEVQEVYAALYHSHVPKLADEGVLDHDRERNVVSLTEQGRALAAVQDDLAEPEGDDVPDSPW